MSADEFVSWQAYERIEPFGFPWQNWVQSRIAMLLDWLQQKKRREDYKSRSDMAWKPPEPLFVERAKKRAARRKRLSDDSSPPIQRDR